ncbi:MAG: hypothetical protein OXC62_16290 [Aestuariivita sp.]|nr:hypothetical protein [Aestuariivita sp.]
MLRKTMKRIGVLVIGFTMMVGSVGSNETSNLDTLYAKKSKNPISGLLFQYKKLLFSPV